MRLFEQLQPTWVQAKAAVDLTKITIETDGTLEGTKITLNGKEIPNLDSFSFGFSPRSSYSTGPHIFYSTSDPEKEVKPGQLRESHYYSLCQKTHQSCCASIRECEPLPQLNDSDIRRATFAQI